MSRVIHAMGELSLLEILRKEKIYMPAICGGNGTCGKCKVKVLKGRAEISAEDEKFFEREQLEDGWRLACKLIPTEDLEIMTVEYNENKMDVLGAKECSNSQNILKSTQMMIGIDIGTTTLAFELADLSNQKPMKQYLTMNRQRSFGADVISRIQASLEGKKQELQDSICEDLKTGI